MMRLSESIRSYLLDILPVSASDQTLASDLQALDAHGLLTVYHNWMSRNIRAVPRIIEESSAFKKNKIVIEQSIDMNMTKQDIENGNDLTKYLSKDVRWALGTQRTPKGRIPHLDLMLNDWGVHHLHISQKVCSDGFVEHDNPLLFAAFDHRTAYLIDVMTHQDWTNERVIHIIADEWPDRGLIYELKGGKRPKNCGLK